MIALHTIQTSFTLEAVIDSCDKHIKDLADLVVCVTVVKYASGVKDFAVEDFGMPAMRHGTHILSGRSGD